MDNSGDFPLRVPGHGFPVGYELPREDRFAHGLSDWMQQPRLTAREVAMLQVMDQLTDKPDWHRKVFEERIVDKWRQEALQVRYMSRNSFDWCLAELRDKALFYEKHDYFTTLETGSRCVKSDTRIGENLRLRLIEDTKALLEDPSKDWHPNSNEQVLNLVHPSMYPLVYGRTFVMSTGKVKLPNSIQDCGKGKVLPGGYLPLPSEHDPLRNQQQPDTFGLWSHKFQWLPCEVRFKKQSGVEVEVTSYINNLAPKHRSLYRVIEQIISLSVRPWNDVLIKGGAGRTPPRIKTFRAEFSPPDPPDWISDLADIEYEEEAEELIQEGIQKVKRYLEEADGPDAEWAGGSAAFEDWMEDFPDGDAWKEEGGLQGIAEAKYKRIREIVHPEPGAGYTYEDWKMGNLDGAALPGHDGFVGSKSHSYYEVCLEDENRERGLQVIVKLASIELSPEKPTYPGGSWHVEGMLNEHIVATSIYYYDVENVTESRLRFRQETDLRQFGMDYPDSDHEPLAAIYGAKDLQDDDKIQEFGSITTKQGRFLAFPNTLQHCVDPFELQDRTRAGHRRLLVLWLVDPNYRIISSANVPPQQHDWWTRNPYQLSIIQHQFPPELTNILHAELTRGRITEDEAKQLRLELMGERTHQMRTIKSNFGFYNFCEH